MLVKVAASAVGCQQVHSSVWAEMARPTGLAPVTSGQALLHESPVGQALLSHLTERGTGAERVFSVVPPVPEPGGHSWDSNPDHGVIKAATAQQGHPGARGP